MSSIITIFGATGNQGGSVADLILSTPSLSSKYHVRTVTRDTSKPAATALAAKGVEVVQADLNDPSSVTAAVAGSYAVFGATDFWSSGSYDVEKAQGIAIADACLSQGVRHFVWSSLPHAGRVSGGKYTGMKHFESKADVEEYIEKKKGEKGLIASYYMPGGFMQNLKQGAINKGEDGVPTWAGPLDPKESRFPWIDVVGDTGKYVMGLIEAGKKADGARVVAVGEWASPEQTVNTIGEVVGTQYRFAPLPAEVFKSFLPPQLATELTETIENVRDFQYYGLGVEQKQAESDKWLLEGTKKTSLKEYVENNGPWPQ